MTKVCRNAVVLFALFFPVLASAHLAAQTSGPVQYVYDQLGRLTAAIDANGNAAVYSYDAVGNILAISRFPSTQVTVISFSPVQGPQGTNVTIYGTGFSTTISQDAVQFNGTAASIVSATANQIVTTVPPGVSTGPITVTSPTGSATSTASFTVTSGSGAPTITGFSPPIVAAGSSVTINGTNFDPALQNDRLMLNTTPASVPTSVTSTSMVMTAPASAGSGHISLNTPGGITTSSGDLYVPPSPFTVSQVGYTGRTGFGTATTVSMASANKVGLLIFDGQAGHTVSITVSSPTFTSCGYQIYKPDNTALGNTASCSSATFLDAQGLPVTGTYTVVVNATAGSAGSGVFTVYDSSDITGTLTPGGPPLTVTTTIPGQNARLSFFGYQNQHVSTTLSNSNFANCTLTVINPDTSLLVNSTNCSSSTTFVEVPYLPERGTYTIKIDPASTQTGTITVKLNDATDITGTLTPGGPSVTPTTTVPGQNAAYTFPGSVNQHVSISISGSTFSNCFIEINNPDGSGLIASPTAPCSTTSTFFDVPLLPQAGTYTLIVDPQGAITGTITVKLNDATDVTGSITTDGTPVTVTTTVPGQNVRLTFTGTAGQELSGVFDNNTIPNTSTISVLSPTGATVETGSAPPSSSGFMDPATFGTYGSYVVPVGDTTLSANGTYTLLIDPNFSGTGSMRVSLYTVPADLALSGTLGGASLPVSITAPGQNARITFSGTLNHKLSINLTGGTLSGTLLNSGCALSVLLPTNALWGGYNCYPASSFLDIGLLPATGTYTVIIDPKMNTTGATNVQLYDDTDISMNINADGSSNAVTTTVPGQNAYLNFSGTNGQRIFAVVNNISGFANLTTSVFSLAEGPSHSVLTYSTQDGSTYNICGPSCGVYSLPATDSYSIFVNPNGTDTGSATVSVYNVPADFSSTIDTAGDPVTVTTTTPGQNAVLTLPANSGQSLSVSLTSGTYPSSHCLLSIKAPNGGAIISNQDCSGASHSFGPYSLSSTGTYTITIDPQYAATGSVIVSATAH